MHQIPLSFCMDEEAFGAYLEKGSQKEIALVFTDNSTSMLSVKTKGRSVSVRIHRMFLSAGEDVIYEIAAFIKNSRIKTPHIKDFIKQNSHRVQRGTSRKVNIKTEGSCYNLSEIYSCINAEYFDGSVSASITWGTRTPKKAAARRTLGSYCSSNNMIRINPMLDNRRVPLYFLEFIIYHEMLHADMGIETNSGRRVIHSRVFKKREKMFEHYEKAMAWEKRGW